VQQLTFPEGLPWQPPEPSDELGMRILAALNDGQVHDRHALAVTVGVSVRQVRAAVSELRALGWPICFGPRGGYQLSWKPDDIAALLRKYRSQALAELRVVNRLKRILERTAAA
jgi:biotin operon repressor